LEIATVEVVTMMAIVSLLLMSALFLGPVVWRIWLDRRQEEADVVGADIRSAINRRLHGESFVAVQVVARSFWRPGRILLSVPPGYESLVEAAWSGIVRRLPPGYELVLSAGGARYTAEPHDEERELSRAA
jgi:hypothetical protein